MIVPNYHNGNYPYEYNYFNCKTHDNLFSDEKNKNECVSGENYFLNELDSNKLESDNSLMNVPLNMYIENGGRNSDEICNLENNFLIGDDKKRKNINTEILLDNKHTNNIQNKTTTCQIETINGKQVITGNQTTNDILIELFKTKEFKEEAVKDLQMLKNKRKRRTKKEIEQSKKMKVPEPKTKKQKGRKRKGEIEDEKNGKKHGKEGDDNIFKKINTFVMEATRNCINKSFLSENMKFQDEKINKKYKRNYLLKLDPEIIINKIEKNLRIKILSCTFKQIFSVYPISKRYKKFSKSTNKDLINKIYEENNQPFAKYMLDMTFLDCLNFFADKTNDGGVINYFKKNYNYDEIIIHKFINNFERIDQFFRKLYKKCKEDGNNDEEIKEYLDKVTLVCLNYKEAFEGKFERKNKKY